MLPVGFFCEVGFLQIMVHDTVNTSDDCAFGIFALGAFSGGISTNDAIHVTLCPTDRLLGHLQAQFVSDDLGLADIGEGLIRTDEVPVDDLDGGWKEVIEALAYRSRSRSSEL